MHQETEHTNYSVDQPIHRLQNNLPVKSIIEVLIIVIIFLLLALES